MGKCLVRKGSVGIKRCAFCKNWYDPVNEAVAPKKGMPDVWEYSVGIKKPCTAKANTLTPSQNCCPKFQCKV